MSPDENGNLVLFLNFNSCNKGDEDEKVQRSDEEEHVECFETLDNSDYCADEEQSTSQDVQISHVLGLDVYSNLGLQA